MIVPIGHEKAVTRFPWVTVGIILLNTAIFCISMPLFIAQLGAIEELQEEKAILELEREMDISPYRTGEEFGQEGGNRHERLEEIEGQLQDAQANLVYRKYGYVPSKFRWHTLFSSLFLHAGFLHLIGNMWFLYLVGSSIEDVWGRRYFLSLYLASGLLACALHGLVYHGSDIPVVGASGAIAGLMGAFMIRNYKVRIRFFYFFLIFIYPLYGTFYLRAYVALGGWFIMQLLFGTISLGAGAGVAYWAHIGGFLVGAGVAIGFKTQRFEEKHIAPRREEQIETVRLHPKLLQAFQARDAGDLEEASKTLHDLILTEPNNIDALMELVNIHVAKGDLRAATKVYDAIVNIFSRDKRTDSLIETYRDIVQLNLLVELSPQNQFRIATMLSERELYEEALNLYRALARSHPHDHLAPLSIFKCAMILLHKLDKPNLAHGALHYILEKYPGIEWKSEVSAQIHAISPVRQEVC